MIRVTNKDLFGALKALEVARNKFNWATDPCSIDAAIYDVNAAELRLSAALLEAKTKGSVKNGAGKRMAVEVQNQ